MKITIYTITDCQFSKQEKEYLASHSLTYEEKNLETNKEFLTEMLAVSNNFAGTPVTKVEKDDGQIMILKGYTKEEFDKALGFEVAAPTAQPVSAPAPIQTAPTQPAPVQDPTTTPPVVVPPVQQAEPQIKEAIPTPVPVEPAAVPAPVSNPPPPVTNNPTNQSSDNQNDPLNSILADLQSKSVAAQVQPFDSVVKPSDSEGKPSDSEVKQPDITPPASTMPNMPDFPAKI